MTLVSNCRNFGSASPFFRLSVCAHIAEFSCYAHKESSESHGTVICTQHTRKHRTLHRNLTQREESNLQQNSSNHKQSIHEHTTVSPQVQHTHAPSSFARPEKVDTAFNSARTAPNTDSKRMRGKATPQCKQQNGGMGLSPVAKDQLSRGTKQERELASEESSSIYRRPRRFTTGFNEPMII